MPITMKSKRFKQFQKMKNDGAQKGDIVEQICKALTIHAEIEEEISIRPPAMRSLKRRGFADEAKSSTPRSRALWNSCKMPIPLTNCSTPSQGPLRICDPSRQGRGRGDVPQDQKTTST